MANHAVQAPDDGPASTRVAVPGRWADEPAIRDFANAKGSLLLVLDAAGERVLHASDAASHGRIADAEGVVHRAIGLAGQMRRLGPLSERPRLARLRLDMKGIAPPALCRIARVVSKDGTQVLLIGATALPSAARARAKPPPAQPEAVVESPDAVETVTPVAPSGSGRIVWRSDGDGRLISVTGDASEVVAALRDRLWAEAASEGEDLLGALAQGRTFRRAPVTIRAIGGRDAFDLEVSGSPVGRSDGAVPRFAGFAILRGRRAVPPDMAEAPDAPPTIEHAPASIEVDQPAEQDESASARDATAEIVQTETPAEPRPVEASASGEAAPALSIDERAAFREIARALGARFAEPDPAAPLTIQSAATAPAADPTEAVRVALVALPAAILVHRAQAILFANRRMFAASDADGIETLQDRWRPALTAPEADDTGLVTLASGGEGESIRLLVERSSLEWAGEPAELLLARAAPAADRAEPPEPEASGPAERVPDAQAVLDRLEDGVVTLDSGGNVLALNTKAASILAGNQDEVIGKNLRAFFDPDGTAAIDASLRQAKEAGTSEPREVAGRSERGSAVPLRVRIARLLAVEESPLYATLQDLASNEQAVEAERRVREAEERGRLRLAFFTEAGQSLRAPLNAVRGIADAMLAEQFGPLGSRHYRDHVLDIRTSSGEALGLIDGLCDLAGIESGRLDLAFADLRLNDLVASCIVELQPRAARDRIVLRSSLAPEVGTLVADERALRRAALNVIAHAIGHSEPGGQVIVSTTLAERGEALLRVRTTSTGMSAEQIERTLDPFRHASLPGTRRTDRHELALTLAKALVEAHRGDFRIASRDGEGTLVEMTLPIAEAAGAGDRDAVPLATSGMKSG